MTRVHGLAHTDTGSGPAVVLLHGLTCHLGYWLRVVPLLEDRRVVALDFRGHGLSAHRDSYAYRDYERDLLDLLDGLGLERVVVAGTRSAATSPCSPRAGTSASPA